MRLQGKETERKKETERETERLKREMEIEMKKERERYAQRERQTRAAKEFNFDQAAKLKQRHLAARGGDRARSLLAVAFGRKKARNVQRKVKKETDGMEREGKGVRGSERERM